MANQNSSVALSLLTTLYTIYRYNISGGQRSFTIPIPIDPLCIKLCVCLLCLLINLIFLFDSENISFYQCTVQYQIFDFRFFVFLYFNFYCFHYLNRSYGRFVLVLSKIRRKEPFMVCNSKLRPTLLRAL